MTVVQAPMRRSYSPDMFADITAAPIVSKTVGKPFWTIEFDADLDEPTVAAIWARMESTDDDDQDRRADLRTLRDAVDSAAASIETFEDVVMLAVATAALDVALANYQLGDAP